MSTALDTKLRRLRLASMAVSFEAQNTESIKHKHGYLEFLQALVDGELESRDNKRLAKRVKAEHFPTAKTLEDFNFDFQPKLDVKLVKSLASCDFVERHENVILVGQPGTGKTHLSIALAIKACEKGFDVRFTTVQELAARLRGAHADHSVEETIQQYIEPDLVVLDELGFTPLDRLLADAFYRIIASRYERRSLIVTSNKSFESWGEVFPDPVIASAVLDRLVHHAHLVPIVGESFRMKDLKTVFATSSKASAAEPLPRAEMGSHFSVPRGPFSACRQHALRAPCAFPPSAAASTWPTASATVARGGVTFLARKGGHVW